MLAPLALLIAGILEIGLMSHSRDVLVSVASDAARATAISGDPQAGRNVAQERINRALGGVVLDTFSVRREIHGGVSQVIIDLKAQVPIFSVFGLRGIEVLGHAVAER